MQGYEDIDAQLTPARERDLDGEAVALKQPHPLGRRN